jgi:hypothetical protein
MEKYDNKRREALIMKESISPIQKMAKKTIDSLDKENNFDL